MSKDKSSLSYRDAGVNIDAGAALVERIQGVAARTRRGEVMAGLGGFAALCQLPGGYKEPVLVSGTDGVGTKLRLAMDLNRHDSIGIDLVAMCVNDLVVTGAEPLFFLDYYATGKLNVDIASDVVGGIGAGCEQAGCALVGGETAEMPGMYAGEDYDLAGFCVGVVEKADIIDGSRVQVGDTLIGLAASGPHSNGYSLIRKILDLSGADLNQDLDGQPLGKVLMEPTRIYVKSLLQLVKNSQVNALSHITGGGLLENLPRVLPRGTKAVVNTHSWPRAAVFDWLQKAGKVEAQEMYRTFNCGIGMVICVPASLQDSTLRLLKDAGEDAYTIGRIEATDNNTQIELLDQSGALL